MIKVLVSACLVGRPVRYNGAAATRASEVLDRWTAEGRLVLACPEVLGGLPVPRPPAEMVGGDAAAVLAGRARVVDRNGVLVTEAFTSGARAALDAALAAGVRVAVLKENSPSCGTSHVHDGTFQGRLVPGRGVAAELLSQAGIRVFSDLEIDGALACVEEMERP